MGKLNKDKAISVIEMQGVDRNGFTRADKDYLRELYESPQKTLSMRNLCSKLDMARETIENEIEPYLIKKDLVLVETRGRKLNIEQYCETMGMEYSPKVRRPVSQGVVK